MSELLEQAAPTPRTPLDVALIRRRAHGRRRRRRGAVIVASLCVVASLAAVSVRLPHSSDGRTVAAGPASSPPLPIEFRAHTATVELRLLDGTRLRLTLPEAVGRALRGTTFSGLALHGSLQGQPAGGEPRDWRIDVSVGSSPAVLPGGEPLAVPSSSRASAAAVDRSRHRLVLQFGSWSLAASGDSLTDTDIDALLRGISLVETPDGFVQYRGPFPLWPVDDADARLGAGPVRVSVFMGDECPLTGAIRPTPTGLVASRIDHAHGAAGSTELCDRANRLRIGLLTPGSLPDRQVDQVGVKVLSVGPTLAAVQRGEHPPAPVA